MEKVADELINIITRLRVFFVHRTKVKNGRGIWQKINKLLIRKFLILNFMIIKIIKLQ